MQEISKKEADAYDKMLDAADNLADLIESGEIEIDENDLEELSVFLAGNGPAVREILKNARYSGLWPD